MKEIARKLMFALLALCMITTVLCPYQVSAASKNTKAHNAYVKKMKSIMKNNSWIEDGIEYYYKDLNGDGVHEVIMLYHDYSKGSSDQFLVYTYKGGKVKKIASSQIYGFGNMRYYKKTKSFVTWSAGHGYEIYRYFKYSKGKYTEVALKCRNSIHGGAGENGPWAYYKGSDFTSTSSSTFKKLIKGIQKGSSSKITYYYGTWKTCKRQIICQD